jgi:hypothetical protein
MGADTKERFEPFGGPQIAAVAALIGGKRPQDEQHPEENPAPPLDEDADIPFEPDPRD